MAEDSYTIYQILENNIRAPRLELSTCLQEATISVNRADYDLVYHSTLELGNLGKPAHILESLYEMFESDCPLDFKGHPLDVSDVVVIRRNGETKAYCREHIGFVEIQEFFSGPFYYYSTRRPISIGTIPQTGDGPDDIVNFDYLSHIEEDDIPMAWGYVKYAKPLSDKDVEAYELMPSVHNSDWVYVPYIQLDARVQVVGRWEDEKGVSDDKRLTYPMSAPDRYIQKKNVPGSAVKACFEAISHNYRRGIEEPNARKDSAVSPPMTMDKREV